MLLASTFAAVLLSGLLAGVNATGTITHTAGRALPPGAWTLRHQVEDGLFRKVMPFLVLGALLSLAALAAMSSGQARGLFGLAAVATLGVVVTTGRLIPLNKQVNTWDGAAPPPQVGQVRAQWLHWHVARTISAVAAFGLAIAAALS